MDNELSPPPTSMPAIPLTVTPSHVTRFAMKKYLLYATPNAEDEIPIETSAGTTLDMLRALSEWLAGWYPWSEAQATIFVLTGIPPVIETLSARADYREDYPALSRIVLTIDPAESPREVADEYRRLRQWFVGPRHREMSDKHIHLALFMARSPKGTTPWAALMAKWNQQHPDWSYDDASNFGRDCGQAQRRLMGTEREPGGTS